MSRGSECLIENNLINYCSNTIYNDSLHSNKQKWVFLRNFEQKVEDTKCCFYDGYPIKGKDFGLPKKRKQDGTFVVWGHFCSMECIRSFIHENPLSCNQTKEQSLLALLGLKLYGVHYRVEKSQDKFLLHNYGGPLSIEEWRQENRSNRIWTIKTPSIERTVSTYECFLDHKTSLQISDINAKQARNVVKGGNKNEKPEKLDNITECIEISKRKTPAHFTKKSLLSLVKVNKT